MRQNAYWNLMTGVCGQTYGNHCVWSMTKQPTDYFPLKWDEVLEHEGAEQMAHLKALRPEMCSYDAGSINWTNDGVFMNTPKFLKKLGQVTMEYAVKPEIEIFDTTMIKNAIRVYEQGCLAAPLHFQLVLGTYGGMDATVDNLLYLRNLLPEGCTYSVTGIGVGSVPMLMAALAMGADGIRVGLEDNLYMSKGVFATNAQQVERAVKLVELANRKVDTAAEARELLHFPKR